MNLQLGIVIICVALAAFFMGRRFLRALKNRSCPGCTKASCCDPEACQGQKLPEELRPRRQGRPH